MLLPEPRLTRAPYLVAPQLRELRKETYERGSETKRGREGREDKRETGREGGRDRERGRVGEGGRNGEMEGGRE